MINVKSFGLRPHLASYCPPGLSCVAAPGCACLHHLDQSAPQDDPTWTTVLLGCKRTHDHHLSIPHTWQMEKRESSSLFFLFNAKCACTVWDAYQGVPGIGLVAMGLAFWAAFSSSDISSSLGSFTTKKRRKKEMGSYSLHHTLHKMLLYFLTDLC